MCYKSTNLGTPLAGETGVAGPTPNSHGVAPGVCAVLEFTAEQVSIKDNIGTSFCANVANGSNLHWTFVSYLTHSWVICGGF
eukprot:2677101-Amphidinium_carterae.1